MPARMKEKPKFDKTRCRKCIYHTEQISNSYKDVLTGKSIACDYLIITGRACIIDTADGRHDKRGSEYDSCRLFQQGGSR